MPLTEKEILRKIERCRLELRELREDLAELRKGPAGDDDDDDDQDDDGEDD